MNYVDSNKTYTTLFGDDNNDMVVFGNPDVGGEFQANVKMEFWDGEDSISLHEEGVKGTPVLKGETIELDLATKKVEWFKEGNVLKWIETLKSKPASNVWSLKIADGGQFTWNFQHSLLDEKVASDVVEYYKKDGEDWIKLLHDDGNWEARPLNIEGSIAVYHKTKWGNKHKTGKVLHIPRPKVVDSNGDWVWCSIEVKDRIYTRTIPPKFHNEAVYPIRINDTFGHTGEGVTESALGPNRIAAFGPHTGAAGDATSVQFYLENCTATPITMGFWDDDTSYPGARVADSAGANETTTGKEWVEQNLDAPAAITASVYYIGLEHDDDSISFWYDAIGGFSRWQDLFGGSYNHGVLANPYPAGVTPIGTRKYSCYITYTPSGSASATPSVSPSVTPSVSPSGTPSISPSVSPSGTPSVSPSVSPSGTPSVSPSGTPSVSPSGTPSVSPSATPSVSPSVSPSGTPSVSPSGTPSVSPSGTPSVSPSVSPSGTPSVSPSGTPSSTPSVSPSGTPSVTPSVSPSGTPSVSPSVTPSATPSVSPSGTPSISPSATPSVTPSATPSVSPSASPLIDTDFISIISSGALEPNHIADQPGSWLVEKNLEVQENAYFGGATEFTKIDSTGKIIFQKASGNGIKVDTTTPTFGFADMLGKITIRTVGGTKPTFTTYNGAIEQPQFSNGDEATLEYHIPHDYVLGTDIHLHVHWSQNAAGATGGTIDFKYTALYAKGHNQASGSVFTGFEGNPITATFSSIDIDDSGSGGSGLAQYQQHLTEVTISGASVTSALFDRDDFEPDGVVILTLEMDADNLTGTPSSPFIHYADLHYQTTGIIGTKSRTPDFYT